MRYLFVLLAWLAATSPAMAQTRQPFNSVRWATVAFASQSALDWSMTGYMIGHDGSYELNPMINWVGARSAPKVMLTGIALDAGVYLLARHLFRHHPTGLARSLWIMSSLRGANNVRTIHLLTTR